MFQVDNLTGHVRMRPRQELARTVRYVAEKIGLATPAKDGLMPATDKAKLDDLGLATSSKSGLMAAADKAKLDRIIAPKKVPIVYLSVASDGYSVGQDLSDLARDFDYIVLRFTGDYDGASTFCLEEFKPGLLSRKPGLTYFLIENASAADINIVATDILLAGYYAPDDMVVHAGAVREVSLFFVGPTRLIVTMSEPLILKY